MESEMLYMVYIKKTAVDSSKPNIILIYQHTSDHIIIKI